MPHQFLFGISISFISTSLYNLCNSFCETLRSLLYSRILLEDWDQQYTLLILRLFFTFFFCFVKHLFIISHRTAGWLDQGRWWMEEGGPIGWRAFHLASVLLSNVLVCFLLSLCFFTKKVPLVLVKGQDTSHRSCSLPVGGGSEDSSSLLLLCGGLGEPGLGLPSATGWRIGRYSIWFFNVPLLCSYNVLYWYL